MKKLSMNYSELTLNEKLHKGLADAGYVKCTPVQEKVLQVSLDGSDLYVQSQTGTGKTAAFLLTIMQELLEKKGEAADSNALVLVPTRELAVQVEEEAKKLGKHTGLKFESFYGGVGYEKQVESLKKGVDVIIGTPGRIIDLTESKQMNLAKVSFLAIDEADRMFDMGFYPDLRKLIKFLPDSDSRQTMLFSATLNSYVKNLAWEYTKDAKEITIEAQNITVDEIDQELIHVSSDDKMKLLIGIIKKENPDSLIIFCDTKKMCEIVSKRLKINGINSEYIIGDLPQSKRLKIMNSFKEGKVKYLVATDVAARGIDVNDLEMVINYDLPSEAENYVHRIGRTARAGKSGKAYSFCGETTEDAYNLMGVEKYIEKKIPYKVAAQEDFAEDKSKDVYIRLDRDEKRSDSRRETHREGRNDSRRRDGKNRSETKGKNQKAKNAQRTFRASEEELDRLAGMSSDERMKYFKEKYTKQQVSPKQRNGQSKQKNPKYASANHGGTKQAKTVAPKKLSLFARIKSVFRHK